MAHLNWRSLAAHEFHVEIVPGGDAARYAGGPAPRTQLRVRLSADRLRELAREMAVLTAELRVDLPQSWILFFKHRDSGARHLIAHPAPSEWVVTYSVEPTLMAELATQLAQAADADPARTSAAQVVLHELAAPDYVSNLESVFARWDSA